MVARGGWCAGCIEFYWMRVLCVYASCWHSMVSCSPCALSEVHR